jgi:hypothetical protein
MGRFPSSWVAFCAALLVVLGLGRAHAQDPRAEAEATYERAASDDDALHFAAALAGYERSIAILPSHRWAQRAETRITFLKDHAEGDFAPLVTLETVRRTPGATKDPARIAALAAAARTFPHGAVRGEALFVCGEAWLTELNDRSAAEAAFEETLAEPKVGPVLRNQAAARLVDGALARGDLERARTFAEKASDPTLAARVAVALRRSKLHVGALALLALFAAFAVGAIVRGRARVREARRFLPWAVGLVLWLGGAGAFLATRYERGNAAPFLAFAAVLLPIVLLARAWGVASDGGPARRAGRALLAASAVFAAAFLLLERIDPRYLEGFGL